MTPASLLKAAGYVASIAGKRHLGFGREGDLAEDRQSPPNAWRSRAGGLDSNGKLQPGPIEVGFGCFHGIPGANSFPPHLLVRDYLAAGICEDSPIGSMESKNYGAMNGGDGARWRHEDPGDQPTAEAVDQLEQVAARREPFFLHFAPHQSHMTNGG